MFKIFNKRKKYQFNPYLNCIRNPYFKASKKSSPEFYEFELKMASLQRYFETNNSYINEYMYISDEYLKEAEKNKEELEKFSVCYSSDKNYFYEIHFLSILSILFSLFENLLNKLANKVSEKTLKPIEKTNKPIPYIKKYIYYLQKTCGMDIKIERKTWKQLEIIRKVRNNYLHSLEKDIPEKIRGEIEKVLEITENTEIKVNYDFIVMAFKNIGKISKILEISYSEFIY